MQTATSIESRIIGLSHNTSNNSPSLVPKIRDVFSPTPATKARRARVVVPGRGIVASSEDVMFWTSQGYIGACILTVYILDETSSPEQVAAAAEVLQLDCNALNTLHDTQSHLYEETFADGSIQVTVERGSAPPWKEALAIGIAATLYTPLLALFALLTILALFQIQKGA